MEEAEIIEREIDPMAKYFAGEVKFVCQDLFNEDLGAVYLFGSQASGKAKLSSDVDVMVVMNSQFSGSQKADIVHEIEDNLKSNEIATDALHILVVNKSEFDNPKIDMINGEKIASAKRNGVVAI